MKDGRASADPGKGARLGWSLRERGKFNGMRGTTPQRREGPKEVPCRMAGWQQNATFAMRPGLSQPIVNL
jgi:hypothetical protein